MHGDAVAAERCGGGDGRVGQRGEVVAEGGEICLAGRAQVAEFHGDARAVRQRRHPRIQPDGELLAVALVNKVVIQAVEGRRPAGGVHQNVGTLAKGADGHFRQLLRHLIDPAVAVAQLGERGVGEADGQVFVGERQVFARAQVEGVPSRAHAARQRHEGGVHAGAAEERVRLNGTPPAPGVAPASRVGEDTVHRPAAHQHVRTGDAPHRF
ncbi:MAG: hypothetical protein BWY76_02781 [bacterium ADurb.Bin429]|nr:MAG: hypothetical protein BWY76_02781 [bacterium ADurb.Bin429]